MLPVPAGTIAIGVFEPDTASATMRTVPSPPAAMIKSAPCSSARTAWENPGPSVVVAAHSMSVPSQA